MAKQEKKTRENRTIYNVVLSKEGKPKLTSGPYGHKADALLAFDLAIRLLKDNQIKAYDDAVVKSEVVANTAVGVKGLPSVKL